MEVPNDQGVFSRILLRSSTPGVSISTPLNVVVADCHNRHKRERCICSNGAPHPQLTSSLVRMFLEGMAKEGEEPDNTPPRSVADPDDYVKNAESVRSPQIYSPAPRSRASDTILGGAGGTPLFGNREEVKSNGRHNDIYDDDADSNVQEGVRSEMGDAILHEPGPNDPPGPKYASYDSGPSFGNFGPLPTDDQPPPASNNPYARSSWNPVWTNIIHENGNGENSGHGNGTGLTEGGLSAYPAGMLTSANGGTPQTSINIDVESPSRAVPSERDIMTSPKPPSRAQSRGPPADQRPWSPFSGRSKLTKATVYPPLPESRMGDNGTQFDGPSSPTSKSRARSKAASISPSESPSQQRVDIFATKTPYVNGSRSPPPGSVMSGGGNHQNRPFSPYRHAPTTEDLINAAARGRSIVIPPAPEKEPSIASKSPSKSPSKLASRESRALSKLEGGLNSEKARSVASGASAAKQPSAVGSRASRARDRDITPTPSRPHSPEGLDAEELRMVNDALGRTPRTSFYESPLEPETTSHFHDMELCVLLHKENDPNEHDFIKKALRKAVRQRIKKLGMKYDHESIKQYRKSYHDHDPSVHMRPEYGNEDPPQWASDLKREIVLMQQRIESLGPKIEGLKIQDRSFNPEGSRFAYEPDESTRTPMTQTVNIQTQPTGTMADSMYQAPEMETILDDDGNVRDFDDDRTENTERPRHPHTDAETRSLPRSGYEHSENGRDDSGGHQVLEEELYKLRQKKHDGSQSGLSHKTWEVAQHDDGDDIYDEEGQLPRSRLPTIPDTNGDAYQEGEADRSSSPPLPDLPREAQQEMAVRPQGPWNSVDYSSEPPQLAPWQRIHGSLLKWAIIWPVTELEQALNSTTRGQQVDEVALSIWSTQAYKRYVRARLTDSPQGVVDRLFVPPNLADAISNAVFNGRHGDACGMLRDLWAPFGLEGTPRLIVVLAKHRSDPNHWVVHRFSLPDGALTTYDSYPERTLPDGRPLGWWFAIRVAWPNTMYPSPDHLVQKMVRLHRPLQLAIDNSVAAAGIWRNVLMGSRAERSVDLERLRDLINTEVKNLKQRKQLGKLSIGAPRPQWEDMSRSGFVG
ncbi:hypothetical protein M413DRAFT_66595 [Hebeloma cylindrosporum]|uniref:Uncharacterized protein n=1 Tax=Hebeloma cylindrosporum TaxID=76867 RepID=A0A0C3CNM6_HEBCY|nr:hypothetical protein M413DRAFT_66595 [Hebeloma cylindrosporum h7]